MTPFRVGLTGGIGSGKSTVAKIFSELNVSVIDADDIGREFVSPGSPVLNHIARLFGSQLVVDGTLDRRRLRRLIFADPEQRRMLEDLLHPFIYGEMEGRVNALRAPYCILSVPLLFETAPPHFVDRVLVVDCSIENQIRRTRSRDRVSEVEVRRIIDAQISRRKRLEAADDVIDNDGDLKSLRPRIVSLHAKYLRLAHVPRADLPSGGS